MPLPDVWGELPRTPLWRSSQNSPSTHLGEQGPEGSRLLDPRPLRCTLYPSDTGAATRCLLWSILIEMVDCYALSLRLYS